jgi:hypothetical protein
MSTRTAAAAYIFILIIVLKKKNDVTLVDSCIESRCTVVSVYCLVYFEKYLLFGLFRKISII